jgi:ketosteroid isomerase-like protein
MPPDEEFRRVVDEIGDTGNAFLSGNSDPVKSYWSHQDDVTIFGGWGAYELGWAEVGARLDWAASRFGGGHLRQEIIASGTSGDLGYTVCLERGLARVAGQSGEAPVVLRVTQIYRRVDGSWKLIHRHADPAAEKTPPKAILQT